MASGKPDIMVLLLNKLLDDGNVLYKVCKFSYWQRFTTCSTRCGLSQLRAASWSCVVIVTFYSYCYILYADFMICRNYIKSQTVFVADCTLTADNSSAYN